jgi:hypothetical protein
MGRPWEKANERYKQIEHICACLQRGNQLSIGLRQTGNQL